LAGFISAVSAFLIWGLSPIFYKSLRHVPPFEILMHRMVWSFLFLLPVLILLKRWKSFVRIFRYRKAMSMLFGTTLLVACNWFVYIWAINNNHILQASLGYYINPLVNVMLAMLFLRERLRRLQIVAVLLALAGVLYLTFSIGQFPWVALTLAFTFAFYGLLRKTAPVEALEGLSIETLLLFIPAAGYLFYLDRQGAGAFFNIHWHTDLLLMASALITAIPLLLFTTGARSLTFVTIGFLQYLAPSCNFLLAVFVYGEPFSTAQAVTFCVIWTALAIFSVDAVMVWKSTTARALRNVSA
jgi:chloramphenicol-sensitive protein RarD